MFSSIGSVSTSVPERNSATIRKIKLKRNDLSACAVTYKNGPTNPPILPTELISPKDGSRGLGEQCGWQSPKAGHESVVPAPARIRKLRPTQRLLLK